MNITFENIWQRDSSHDEVIAFWKNMGALPVKTNLSERAKQLVYIARHEGDIVGVTTAHRVIIKNLNSKPFFNFRVLINPDYRIPGFVDKLCVLCRDFLESQFTSGKSDCIGMITLSENKGLLSGRNEAVWSSSGFTFIGNSKAGYPIRVVYFKGAKI